MDISILKDATTGLQVDTLQEEKLHDNIVIGVCLSLVGGFLDAYSYLLKGRVFANAQTGNVVLLFISAANRELHKSLKYILPIITFAFGIFISEFLKNKHYVKNYARMVMVLVFEVLTIAAIGLTGTYFAHDIINSVISFIAALQVVNFDKVDGNPIATTMITGNLKSSMINFAKYRTTKDVKYLYSFFKYILIIASFGVGVAVGFITIQYYAEKSILLCEVFIIIAFIMLQREEKLV
nr:YoaK family protein [uncultured Treponema sp.]